MRIQTSVQPQQHSIVCSLKSTWTVKYKHATIVFSVLHTMTSSSCFLLWKTAICNKVFLFLCNACFAEKMSNVIRGDVPNTMVPAMAFQTNVVIHANLAQCFENSYMVLLQPACHLC